MRIFNELFILKQDSFSIKRPSPLNRHRILRQAQCKMSAEIVPFLSCLVTKDESNGIIPNTQMRTKDCGHHLTTPPHATHSGAATEIWDLLISDRYFSHTSPITEMIAYLLFQTFSLFLTIFFFSNQQRLAEMIKGVSILARTKGA